MGLLGVAGTQPPQRAGEDYVSGDHYLFCVGESCIVADRRSDSKRPGEMAPRLQCRSTDGARCCITREIAALACVWGRRRVVPNTTRRDSSGLTMSAALMLGESGWRAAGVATRLVASRQLPPAYRLDVVF